jgi:hypothetical protein
MTIFSSSPNKLFMPEALLFTGMRQSAEANQLAEENSKTIQV